LTSSLYDANADDLFIRSGGQFLNGLGPDYLKSMFTDRSDISTYTLMNCEGKLAVPLPRTNFQKKPKAVEQLICQSAASTKLLLVLNPAVRASFLIMMKLINHN